MADTSTLLWEVGCEELPAWAVEAVLRQLPGLVTDALAGARLDVDLGDGALGAPEVWAGPRRFAVRVPVRTSQRAEVRESRGPAYDAAFTADGTPTKACTGFARGKGLEPAELEVRDDATSGRRFVWAVEELPATPFHEVWPALAARVLGGLQFAKPMRWGLGEHRFVRPVRWVLTLLGDQPVAYELWGVPSSDVSRTHRFLGSARETRVASASQYEDALAEGHVVVDQHARRTTIGVDLDHAAAAVGGAWDDPAGVLREVVHLIEQPTVITGRFDERHLELPARVLVTAMQSHQRYLPVLDGAGALRPAFLAVMNGDPAAVDSILPGYERVLSGRLDDAAFSVGRDRERGLDDMAASLGAVAFHAKAGSLADRTERIVALALDLADQLDLDEELAATAARLAKADQVSVLVQEFAELEGFAGARYAEAAGEPDEVVRALEQQFLPRSATDDLADAGVPAVLALADKLDLLLTTFAIGEQPTGSRDPHGLRRAAIGVVRTILEHDLPVDLDGALAAGRESLEHQGFGTPDDALVASLRSFLDDRVEKLLTDDGVGVDAVRAARGAAPELLQQLVALARTLDTAARSASADFLAVLTALKRCVRILAKAGGDAVADEVHDDLLLEPSERALATKLAELAPVVRSEVEEHRYDAAVRTAAQLGPDVDAFFDRDAGVLVMADDPAVQGNRLALLRSVVDALAPLGDLTELQVG